MITLESRHLFVVNVAYGTSYSSGSSVSGGIRHDQKLAASQDA